jgi:hypothetical protein
LVMDLLGIDDLSGVNLDAWIEITENFTGDYFNSNPEFGVGSVDVEILVVNVIGDGGFRARRLQGDFVTIVYDQKMSYVQTPDSTLTPEQVAALPFVTPASRSDYVQLLQDPGGLTDIIGSFDVTVGFDDDGQRGDQKGMKKAKRGKKSGKRTKSSKKTPKPDKYSKKTKLESKKKKSGKRK